MTTIELSSIQQTHKNYLTTSGKYRFIPTTQVLGILADSGWAPFEAKQARVSNPEHDGYQRHLVRLRNADLSSNLAEVGDVVPEIVVVNSHGGASSFQLYASLLEKVCGNGLIVDRPAADYRIPHVGYADSKVEAVAAAIVEHFPHVLATRKAWQSLLLGHLEQLRFARRAAVLRFGDRATSIDPEDLLRVRHAGQSQPTLWNTFNVIQEATIRGGVRRRLDNGKRSVSRGVNAIDDAIRLNRLLWRLAADEELS